MFERDANRRAAALLAGAAASGVAFAMLNAAVSERKLSKQDRKALGKIKVKRKTRRAAKDLHPYGKWWVYVPAALTIGAAVIGKGSGNVGERSAGAAAIVASALIAAALNPAFDKLLPQPPLPPGRKANPKPSFPSGHAAGLGELGLTSAYVLAQQKMVRPAVSAPIALALPLIGGIAKMIEKKHWPSEVTGGLLLAICISALSLAGNELVRARVN